MSGRNSGQLADFSDVLCFGRGRVIEMKKVLQASHISKVINGKTIVDDFSIDMYEGEIVGLLGPNGAGKTTIMRMMVGLIEASEGEILIGGSSIRSDFIHAIAKVGAVIETPEMYPYLTGYENLELLSNINGKVSKEEIDEIIHLVQLENSIHDRVKTYSLGMRQRLGVAQALIHSPELIILDEPMNGLDPIGVKQLRDYLIYVAKEKKVAILVSSHILSEIEIMCDRVVMIANGREVSDLANSRQQSCVYQVQTNTLVGIQKIIGKEILNENEAENTFQIELENEEVPQCIRRLVQGNIDIFLFEKHSPKLEDKFISVIEGKHND